MRKRLLISLFLIFFVALVNLPCVFADDVNFLELPEKVGEVFFGGNTFAGGLVCTFVLFMFFLLPTLFLCRNQDGSITLVAVSMVVLPLLCSCVAIGWLDSWTLLIIAFTDLIFVALNLNRILGGRGSG